MCRMCFEDYGEPQLFTDKVQQATAILGDPFWPLNALDEILNGWDLRDDTIAHCRRKARNSAECDFCLLLLQMSMAERAATLAIDQGYLDPTEINSDYLDNCMENERITLQALVPLFVRGELFEAGDAVEVSRERARTFIQKGHAKPHPALVEYENQAMDVAPKTTPKRKRTRRSKSKSEDE